jgi:hypothetical protein
VGRAKVAGNDLDQRRLAGAVIAHQSDDFAGLEIERDIVERMNGAEMLDDVSKLENRHPRFLPRTRPIV